MMKKWYEITCDYCSCAEHFLGTAQSAERQYRSYGGIVTQDKKHYCAKECYANAKRVRSNK